MCLQNVTRKHFYKKHDGKKKFKNALLSAAASEAKFLFNNYEDKHEALQAIKYTFADIGDIIKGKDMMDDMAYKKIKVKLEKVLDKTQNDPEKSSDWWEENKKHVWNVMLCGYQEAGGTIEPNDCNIPYEENTKQFLRWLIEWGRQVCKEKVIQKRLVDDICNNSKAFGSNSSNKLEENSCKTIAMVYDNWNKHAYNSLVQLNKEYKRYIGTSSNSQKITESSAEDYLKKTCKECNCSFSDIKKTYERSIKPDFEVLKDIVNKSSIPPDLEDIFNKYNGPYVSCPDSNLCIPYKNIPCFGNEHDDDTDWSPSFIKHNNRINKGVLLPPRRKHLCLRIYRAKFYHLRKEINNFKEFIFSSAFAEAKRLKKVYKDDNNKLLHAMKYSFSDIGNIVKGDDMMEGTASDNIAKIFKGKKYKETNRKKWWNENKYHVWESMLCGYRQDTGQITNNENCRFPDIESVPQFLRWFQEWTKIFCTKRNKLYDKMVSACENAQCDKKIGNVQGSDCMKACEKYKYYVLSKKKEYEIQSNKYDKEFKMTLKSKTAPEFLNVPCLSQYFSEKIKWENPYDTFDDDKHKGKCDCKKIESSAPVVPDSRPSSEKPEPPLLPPSDEPFDPTILQTTIPFGVAGTDSGYTDHYSDITSSSESEYEEMDINDIYAPRAPKYKTLIEVVLEPSGNNTTASGKNTPSDTQNDIPSGDTPNNKLTDNEWNTLKDEFISNMLQNQPNDVPNDYSSGDIPLNTQPNTLYFDKPDEKPFIMFIQDRNLLNGEEINYNINMSTNSMDDPKYVSNNVYSGIDLINDSLNGEPIDIYDELLKRKENELFGTNHVKQTSIHSVAKLTNSDPIHNQLELFHKWLDRHRDMCEQWENHHERLAKLKEEWENETHSGNIHTSDSNKTLNTDVSIQIHMDNPKPINEFTYVDSNPNQVDDTYVDSNPDNSSMDTILEDLDKPFNEPYYYDMYDDDIYYDVHDHDTSTVDSNAVNVPSKVQIEMDINTKLVKEKYPIADVWDI
ncbi:hypothetical protein C923_04150 [Plasmodium falciparum UGT5.1]|uniref:Uncharacterized protein n=1 Tax=Plasmodium falciparum UGT5.1 TaxID=1237627 RepID=W7JK03_PLAFA|nr:hypothetical protein C923_04150 [Plasmodium falciparum UGT5.1]